MYRYRYDILFWWVIGRRKHKLNSNPDYHAIPEGDHFDAFLSYSSCDLDFALMMHKRLEHGDDIQYSVAIDARDFEPGLHIVDNIAAFIGKSDRIIILLSKNFLASGWTEYELRMAEARCFQERKNLIILIFMEEIPNRDLPRTLQTLVRHVTYLVWPDDHTCSDSCDDRACKIFWKRLKLALRNK